MNHTTPAQEWMNTAFLNPEKNQPKENHPREKQILPDLKERANVPPLLQLGHEPGYQGAHLREKCYEKGTYLFFPQEKADKLFFIVEGRIKIGQYSESGQEIVNAIHSQGEIFGIRALTAGLSRDAYALAMEHTTCRVLYPEELKVMIRKQPALSIYIMEQLGSRMHSLEKRLGALTFHDSRTRILRFLHEMGCKQGQRIGYEVLIQKFLTQKEIACLTSTSRQTVNMVLNDLRNKNLISFNRKRLLIRDLEELKKIAQASTKNQYPSLTPKDN